MQGQSTTAPGPRHRVSVWTCLRSHDRTRPCLRKGEGVYNQDETRGIHPSSFWHISTVKLCSAGLFDEDLLGKTLPTCNIPSALSAMLLCSSNPLALSGCGGCGGSGGRRGPPILVVLPSCAACAPLSGHHPWGTSCAVGRFVGLGALRVPRSVTTDHPVEVRQGRPPQGHQGNCVHLRQVLPRARFLRLVVGGQQ